MEFSRIFEDVQNFLLDLRDLVKISEIFEDFLGVFTKFYRIFEVICPYTLLCFLVYR